MSSVNRLSPHRRRSHSASSPLPSYRLPSNEEWRSATKRARPNSLRVPSYKNGVYDKTTDKVDRWRRGKRARRDSPSPVATCRAPCLFGSSPVFRREFELNCSMPPSLTLPSTSDAFQLFPTRPRPTRSSSSLSSPLPASRSSSPSCSTSHASASESEELGRLRSSAFWELHQSIEENGEGLVSRMRDWEEAYSRSHVKSLSPSDQRSHENSSRGCKGTSGGNELYYEAEEDDEDDVQIIALDVPSQVALSLTGTTSPKKRSYSMSDMDVDEDVAVDDRCSSPIASSSGPSGYASDEDSSASLTYTNSTNSSLISLPLHHLPYAVPTVSRRHDTAFSDISLPSSPSEKAIAALSLVMANGAGGLNDYEAVRALDGAACAVVDDSLVGEMWH